jgi:hypothetical protein
VPRRTVDGDGWTVKVAPGRVIAMTRDRLGRDAREARSAGGRRGDRFRVRYPLAVPGSIYRSICPWKGITCPARTSTSDDIVR